MEQLFSRWSNSSLNIIGYPNLTFSILSWIMDPDRLIFLLALQPFISDEVHDKRQKVIAGCAGKKMRALTSDAKTKEIAREYVKLHNEHTNADLPLTKDIIAQATAIVVLLQMASNNEFNPELDKLVDNCGGCFATPAGVTEFLDTT